MSVQLNAILKKSIISFLVILLMGCQPQKTKENDSSTERPNVLIIYPDQLRRYSAGFWSEVPYKNHVIGKPDPIVTPNIDKLAKNGVVFTQAISNYPLCSPNRGMLLSGMYPEQNGIWNNCRKDRDDSLKDEISTITDLFYNAGYNTSYFGKCHWLKTEPLFDEKGNYVGTNQAPGGNYVNSYDTYVPAGAARHNIEYFFQSLKDEHYNPHVYSNDPNTIEGKKDGELFLPKVYSPKIEAEKIVDYLQNKNAQRDSNKPFCMIWALNPPHNPWDDKNTEMEVLKKYYDSDKYPKIDTSLVVRKNANLKTAQYARNYFAAVTSADTYIGIVLNELKKMGALNNTIVILTSDHGEMLGSHGLQGKNVLEMEAIAVPFIVHWPNGVKANINDILLSATDILPTTMGLAGLGEKIPSEVQGKNLANSILNPSFNHEERSDAALLMLNNSRGVLTNRYTLCIQEEMNEEKNEETYLIDSFLYDNLKDPYQLNKINLNEKPEVAKELLTKLGKLLKKANDPWFQKRKHDTIILYPKE